MGDKTLAFVEKASNLHKFHANRSKFLANCQEFLAKSQDV
jgi:hypothetical protein